MASVKDLITRRYQNFRGVDFSHSDVQSYRSPLSINMWKNSLFIFFFTIFASDSNNK